MSSLKRRSADRSVEDETIASIGPGIVVLVGCEKGDGEEEAKKTAKKVLETRVFANDAGALWERNVTEVEGEVLCVSQFTLLASVQKGTKPSTSLLPPCFCSDSGFGPLTS